jgi:hypothetical protein
MESRIKSSAVNQDIISQLYTTTLHNNIAFEGLSSSQSDHDSSANHVPWFFQEQGSYKRLQGLSVSA